MDNIISGLEEIARLVRGSSEESKVQSAIASLRALKVPAELDVALETWQKKCALLLQEPAAREGMAKHARHWAEKLKNGR